MLPKQWERIERAAQETVLTANQLVTELAIEALDRREWPRTATESRDFISTIVPDTDLTPPAEEAKQTVAVSHRHRTT